MCCFTRTLLQLTSLSLLWLSSMIVALNWFNTTIPPYTPSPPAPSPPPPPPPPPTHTHLTRSLHQTHSFPKLKKAVSGAHFQSDDDVRNNVDDFLDSQERDFLKNGIDPLTSLQRFMGIVFFFFFFFFFFLFVFFLDGGGGCGGNSVDKWYNISPNSLYMWGSQVFNQPS